MDESPSTPADPTQVVSLTLTDPYGETVVPNVGTVYRMSDHDGLPREDMVLVAMTQADYNALPDLGARLGLATTGDLLRELRARFTITNPEPIAAGAITAIHDNLSRKVLAYRTVNLDS